VPDPRDPRRGWVPLRARPTRPTSWLGSPSCQTRRGWVPLRARHAVGGFCRGFRCGFHHGFPRGLVSTWVSLLHVGGFCHGWVSPSVGFAVGEFRWVTRVLNRVSVGFEADFGGSRGF
jgi:hypothetical protein